jgi:hypothetical protein
MSDADDAKRYTANLQGEVDGAAIYKALADNEESPQLAELFRRLGAIEEAHAEFWRGQIRKVGGNANLTPSGRARVFSWLARRFGPAFVAPTIAAGEARDRGMYDNQPETQGTSLPDDERSHARLMSQVGRPAGPGTGHAGRPPQGRRRQCAARRRSGGQ